MARDECQSQHDNLATEGTHAFPIGGRSLRKRILIEGSNLMKRGRLGVEIVDPAAKG